MSEISREELRNKAIRHFECMKNDACVVLDSGFGTKKGESDLVYRNRKLYAEMAISALQNEGKLEKIEQKINKYYYENCSNCAETCYDKGVYDEINQILKERCKNEF